MKRDSIKYFLVFLLSFVALQVFAQGLPTLKRAPEINVGKLPDGISYYLVTNSSSKGYANFALVQKGALSPVVAARNLASLPHFPGKAPYKFLASKGIGYTRDGYAVCRDGATIYNFENVPTFDSHALDSTLLLIFDIASTYSSEQAIIVSGEYNLAVMKDRLYVLSLNIPKVQPVRQPYGYEWTPSDEPVLEQSANGCRNAATLTVDYSAPRTPKNKMNTPQVLVTDIFAQEMGYLLCKRVQRGFLMDGIPLGDVRYEFFDSSMSDSDEHHRLSIVTDVAKLREATGKLAAILADIDTHGAAADEFKDAKDRIMTEAGVQARRIDVSNREYVRRCIASYLLGSNLASYSSVGDFLIGRKIAPERELALFNSFASAVLDPRKALTIRLETPSGDVPGVLEAFDSSWRAAAAKPREDVSYHVHYADTLTLLRPRGHKVKIKSTTKEPVTGGSVWTFSNGMKVIFKKAGSKGEFHYALMLKGGCADVPGLAYGESAFVEDMLRLYNIGGMNYLDFRNMLEANGIIFDSKVSLADMRISGRAPVDKIHLLFKALVSLMRDRSINPSAMPYYRSGESLRQECGKLEPAALRAVMDSIMCPTYQYPETKNVAYLRDDLPQRVEQYVTRQFSKANDGVLVIIGQFEEESIQKILTRYLGAFITSGSYAVRPKVKYLPGSGTSTYFVDAPGGNEALREVNVSLATLRPYTMDSYIAFRAAVAAIRKEVVAHMADIGMEAEVKPSMLLFPENRMGVYIRCKACNPDGLPEGVAPADPYSGLAAVRNALASVSSRSINSTDLAGYKQMVSDEIASENKIPANMVQSVLLRNSEGKDFVSNYQEHVSFVTAADVMDIIKALCTGSRVEYVVK
ncbi:MAG: hypothetical protein J5771_00530 [Bacteroidales bacterium]|nr:hypothetical protein [Bacteroidales bacterium]